MARALGLCSARRAIRRTGYDGKTDKQIVRDVMRMEGHSDQHIDSRMEKLDRFVSRWPARGSEERKVQRASTRGSGATADALDGRENIILGLLTGNVEPGARIKLMAAGIDPDRFKVNAFDPITSIARNCRRLRGEERARRSASTSPAIGWW